MTIDIERVYIMSSFQTMMAYDNYQIRLQDQEYKDKLHKDALRKRQYMQQCPVCKEYKDFITNVHCVNEHGMTKKEVEKKYGKITNGNQARKNKKEEGK